MAEIKIEERVTMAPDKNEPVFEITQTPVPVLKGNQIIGGVTQGNLEGGTHEIPNITRPIQSPNFKSGTSGWRLNSNGVLEAYNAIIT